MANGCRSQVERKGERLVFTLRENGGYVLELDDYHGLLYIFNNKPVLCKDPSSVTHYFGAGVHHPGKIVLQSGESVFVDKDALVYGCIFADGAENIRVFGNGVLDDSLEERECAECYEPYTNGNLKLYNCKQVKIEGVGFTNSAVWCINLFHCEDVSIDGVRVFGQWRYNTDGIDIVNSERVTVRNSFVHSFDDSITVKGIDKYSEYNCRDMLFENCVLWCDWGMTCEIGLETSCRDYSNITFRNIDILRAAACACDVANGDCAYVHDVTFEDIRIEMENFYTPSQYQKSDDMEYSLFDKIEIPLIFKVSNNRFRDAYVNLISGLSSPYPRNIGESNFASANNIVARNINVYCDAKILEEKSVNEVLKVTFRNVVEGTEYGDITISDLTLNGKAVSSDDLTLTVIGKVEKLHILE